MYKQPVILFGIVIPLIIAAMIVGVTFVLRGNVVSSYEVKARNYSGYQASKTMALETEAQIGRQREVFQEWSKILEQESFALFTTNMKIIGDKLPSDEFQLTSSERLNNKSGFGTASVQKSSSLKFSMRGTYRSVQKALLELETRMPNMQLQDFRIDPSSKDSTSLLNFTVTYVAWEK